MTRTRSSLLVTGCLLFSIIFLIPSQSREQEDNGQNAAASLTGLVIDNFENYNSDILNRNWNLRHAWKFKEVSLDYASRVYRIRAEDGNHFLHASTESNPEVSVVLVRLVNSHKVVKGETVRWNLKTHPFLSWRWRVTRIPEGAKEDNKRRFDNAASVFVVFVRYNLPLLPWDWQPIDVLQYTWSSTMPRGSRFAKKAKRFGFNLYEGRFIILQTGTGNTGTWIHEKRNILQDYRECFGHNPSANPMLLAIISDSDKTKSVSIADYDDFLLLDR